MKKEITFRDKIYKFMYREDIIKKNCWYMNNKGKWICRVDKKTKRR